MNTKASMCKITEDASEKYGYSVGVHHFHSEMFLDTVVLLEGSQPIIYSKMFNFKCKVQ
jgi:hypothetical protein